MISNTQIDLREFTRRPTAVALLRPADDLFGLMTRTVELPSLWAALVTRETGDAVYIRPGGEIKQAGVKDVLFVRTGPLEIESSFGQLVSSDGYDCGARVVLRVELVAEPAELRAFREAVMGSSRFADLDSIQRCLAWPMQTELRAFAEARSVEALVAGNEQSELAEALQAKLKPALFAAGLAQRGPARSTFESTGFDTVRATRQHEAQRRDEHAAREEVRLAVRQAQQAHIEHLDGLLGRLSQLAERSPDLSLSDLLRTFSENDRGQLYQGLWQALPEQAARWIVAASGQELLFFEPGRWDAPVRRLTLTDEVGPARSVTVARDEAGHDVLLIGAARGVHVLDLEGEAPRATYRFTMPEAQSLRSGVNAAALGGGRVFASHSEMGLVVWPVHEPGASVRMLTELTADARTVRQVRVQNEQLWFTVDAQVVSVPLGEIFPTAATIRRGSTARISALDVDADGVYAGNEDGEILRWAIRGGDPDAPERLRSPSGRTIESIEVLNSAGVQRLVYADESTALNVLVIGDAYGCRYEGHDQRVRRAAVAGDWLVAINDRRDRLLCWRPYEPSDPCGIMHVSRLTGRSVQDLCIVTRATQARTATA